MQSFPFPQDIHIENEYFLQNHFHQHSKIVVWGDGISSRGIRVFLEQWEFQNIFCISSDPFLSAFFDEDKLDREKEIFKIQSLCEDAQFIFIPPGLNIFTHPFFSIENKRLRSKLTGELDLLFWAIKNVPGKQWIWGLSGSNGKTTSVCLAEKIYRTLLPSLSLMPSSSQVPLFVGGNIGKSLLAWACLNEGENLDQLKSRLLKSPLHILLEISSFQLDLAHCALINGGVLTNIIPTHHAERYPHSEDYIQSKMRLQKMSIDHFYSFLTTFEDLSKYSDIDFFWRDVEKQLKLLGKHNQSNFYTAALLVEKMILTNFFHTDHIDHTSHFQIVKNFFRNLQSSIDSLFTPFQPPEHRLEFFIPNSDHLSIKTIIEDDYFINDSKSTNLESLKTAINALSDLSQKWKAKKKATLFLWVGGSVRSEETFIFIHEYLKYLKETWLIDQNIFQELYFCFWGEFFQWCDSRSLWADQFGNLNIEILPKKIMNILKNHTVIQNKDHIICHLFSPACPSTDQFKNFEERGQKFKNVIAPQCVRLNCH